MEYNSVALVFFFYLNNVYGSAIQCTVNCNKVSSGSSPISVGGSDLLSAPIIGAAPSDVVNVEEPPLPPFMPPGPEYTVDPKPVSNQKSSKPRKSLPPHIMECLEGKGGRNCERYSRLNTEANRRRFLVNDKSKSGKDQSGLGATDGHSKSKHSQSDSQTISNISLQQLKTGASKSITDSINSIVDALTSEAGHTVGTGSSLTSGIDSSAVSVTGGASSVTKSTSGVRSDSLNRRDKISTGKQTTDYHVNGRAGFDSSVVIGTGDASSFSHSASGGQSGSISRQGKVSSRKQSTVDQTNLRVGIDASIASETGGTSAVSNALSGISSGSSIRQSGIEPTYLDTVNVPNAGDLSAVKRIGEVSRSKSGRSSTSATRQGTLTTAQSSGGQSNLLSAIDVSAASGIRDAALTSHSVSGTGTSISASRQGTLTIAQSSGGQANLLSAIDLSAANGIGDAALTSHSVSGTGTSSSASRQGTLTIAQSSGGQANVPSAINLVAASGIGDAALISQSVSGASKSISDTRTITAGQVNIPSGIDSSLLSRSGDVSSISQTLSRDIKIGQGSFGRSDQVDQASVANEIKNIPVGVQSLSSVSSSSINAGGSNVGIPSFSPGSSRATSGSRYSGSGKVSPSTITVGGSSGDGPSMSRTSGGLVSGVTDISQSGTAVSGQVTSYSASTSDTPGTSDDQSKKPDRHNEDGSKGMNQDDSKGKNQDKKDSNVNVQSGSTNELAESTTVTSKQTIMMNKFNDDDGSKGLNQDGSHGKISDQSRATNQDGSHGTQQDGAKGANQVGSRDTKQDGSQGTKQDGSQGTGQAGNQDTNQDGSQGKNQDDDTTKVQSKISQTKESTAYSTDSRHSSASPRTSLSGMSQHASSIRHSNGQHAVSSGNVQSYVSSKQNGVHYATGGKANMPNVINIQSQSSNRPTDTIVQSGQQTQVSKLLQTATQQQPFDINVINQVSQERPRLEFVETSSMQSKGSVKTAFNGLVQTASTGSVKKVSPGSVNAEYAGPVQTASSLRSVQTASPGSVNAAYAGPVQTASLGSVNAAFARPIQTASPGLVQTASSGSVNAAYAGPVQTASLGSVQTVSHGSVNAAYARPAQTASLGLVQTASSGSVNAAYAEPVQTAIQTDRGVQMNLDTTLLTQKQAANQDCSCSGTLDTDSRPQIVQATAKLALVGDRNVLIAKVPKAKVIDSNGNGVFHLEFPNLVIQPTLTETIASPSELFGMNLDQGAGSTTDSEILVVALLPKGSTLGSDMFQKSFDKSSQSAGHSPSVSEPTMNEQTSSSSGPDTSVDLKVSLVKQSPKVSVETSKDDGKLKVQITAEKLKDSTISSIKDTLENIKSDGNISVETSKDDDKFKIKIKADTSKDAQSQAQDKQTNVQSHVAPSKGGGATKVTIDKQVQQTEIQSDTATLKNGGAATVLTDTTSTTDQSNTLQTSDKTTVVKSAVVPALTQDIQPVVTSIQQVDTSLVKSKVAETVSGARNDKQLPIDVPASIQVQSVQQPNDRYGTSSQQLTTSKLEEDGDQGRIKAKETVLAPQVNGKVKYETISATGTSESKATRKIKTTIDTASGPAKPKTVSIEAQQAIIDNKSQNGAAKLAINKQETITKPINRTKLEEDGDQGKTKQIISEVTVNRSYTTKTKPEEDGDLKVTSKADVSALHKQKIAEAVKVLQALQDAQSLQQQEVKTEKATLPDTMYKLPSAGESLKALSQKLTNHIISAQGVSTDQNVQVGVDNNVAGNALSVNRLTTTVSKELISAADKKTPNLEALCLIYLGAFIDSIGYAPFPGKCHKLIQCFYLGGQLKAVVRDCPAGMFWDQTMLLCRPPEDVLCLEDRCLVPGTIHYRRDGGCNCFFKCTDGISVPSCCPKGYKYDDDKECVPAKGQDLCDDECETPSILTRTITETSCPSLPDPMNKYGYLAPQYGGLRIRACPAGTLYSKAQCRCKSNNGNGGSLRKQYRQCSAEFKVNFDDGIKDISQGGLAFDVSHVFTRQGKGVFSGNSKMYIWGFASRYLGKTFAMRFRLKVNRGAGKYKTEPIISNCGAKGDASIELGVRRGKLIFKAKTSDNPDPIYYQQDIEEDKWLDVTYFYDGDNFGGSCNGKTFKQRSAGNLEIRDNPLTIGLCSGESGFHGEIDELEIYTACIPKDM